MCPVFLLLLVAVSIECHQADQHKDIRGKMAEYMKTAAWQPLKSQAYVDGSLILTVLRKYKIPIKTQLLGNSGIHKAVSCTAIKKAKSNAQNGVYTIYPDGKTKTRAYCDMTTDGGGWTVFQRRFEGKVDFYRNWASYKEGFGDPAGEHWLGNDVLHELTNHGGCTLRVDMVSLNGDTGHAMYSNFTVDSERKAYRMDYEKYLGTVGDALSYHKGQKFTTPDRDNDSHPKLVCSTFRHGAWWYNACAMANLNGKYGDSSFKGMEWRPWGNAKKTLYMKKSKMMVKC